MSHSTGGLVVAHLRPDEHASADQVELYDGGHELFASSGRESHAERVVAALDCD